MYIGVGYFGSEMRLAWDVPIRTRHSPLSWLAGVRRAASASDVGARRTEWRNPPPEERLISARLAGKEWRAPQPCQVLAQRADDFRDSLEDRQSPQGRPFHDNERLHRPRHTTFPTGRCR